MAGLDEFVGRIVARAKILRSSTRDDLERELRGHFADAMEDSRAKGDEGDPREIARRHFGNPEEIGEELERVHRFERYTTLATDALLLIATSVVAVAIVVLSFQLSIALSIGIAPSHAFPRFRGQIIGFVALSLGYMSLYLEERLMKQFQLVPAFILNLCAFTCLFALFAPVLQIRTVAPGIPFIAGALARFIQKTSLHRIWYCGIVLPTLATVLTGGRLLSTGGETSLWVAVFFRCIGQAAACYFLTLLSQGHEVRRSTWRQ